MIYNKGSLENVAPLRQNCQIVAFKRTDNNLQIFYNICFNWLTLGSIEKKWEKTPPFLALPSHNS